MPLKYDPHFADAFDKSEFQNRLISSRKGRHLTQADVVKRTSIESVQVLSNYEHGKREPRLSTLCELSLLYGVSLDYLLLKDKFKRKAFESIEELKSATRLDASIFLLAADLDEVSNIINAVFRSNEIKSIHHEAYRLQNMLERIKNCQCAFDPAPDNETFVTIDSEDYFRYHAMLMGQKIAAAVSSFYIEQFSDSKLMPEEKLPF